jgi:hypothetical protein
MDRVGSKLREGLRKIRLVTKLTNKGFLGKFMHNKGAKWFTLQNHADSFITALGDKAVGASIKKRNHPIIAYYVPLSLNMDNLAHLVEIPEANNIQEGDITKIRWAKPPARRALNQICGHLIINFSGLDAVNRAKIEGLLICNKKVSVSKYKREPIRCLKCHGWNHVTVECTQAFDRCGTCVVLH